MASRGSGVMATASGRGATAAASPNYDLLASGIAGRRVRVLFDSDHDAPPTHTDGTIIRTPAAKPDRLAVMAQAALIGAGSLEDEAMRALSRRPALAAHYLCFELRRAAHTLSDRLPGALAQHAMLSLLPVTAGATASLELARQQTQPAEPMFGVLKPSLVLARQRRRRRGSGEAGDAPEGALRRYGDAQDEDALEESKVLDAFTAPLDRAAQWLSDLMASLFDMQPGGHGGRGQGGTGGAMVERSAQAFGEQQRRARGRGRANDSALEGASQGGRVYPEWHQGRGKYLQDWAHVAEVEPHPDHSAGPLALPSPAQARRWAQPLSRLCLDHEPHRRQRQGEELCLDALVQHELDRRAGVTPDERIYRASLRTRRDLGVLVLLDMTASTGDQDASGSTVFAKQARFGISLMRALRMAGDRAACFGFHSWGRKLVRMQRVVDFDEPYDSAALTRLGRLAPSGYSRLGAAIRHGSHMLEARSGMPYRLLVFVSDGIAYDQGYERGYGAADTRRALREVRGQGTACVCVSLGSEQSAGELAEVFGSAFHLTSHDETHLEAPLTRLFSDAIQHAAQARGPRTAAATSED